MENAQKAAYRYVFTRTWAPPYDYDAVSREAEHAFLEGTKWRQTQLEAARAVAKYHLAEGDPEAAAKALLEATDGVP